MSPLDRLAPYRAVVEAALFTALEDVAPPRLKEACLHYPRAGGKRLRPIMALLGAEAAGGRREDAIPVAVALEAIHNFSLIHDDIMDRDALRRGLPTVHTKWDEPTAILAGDTLFAKAFEVLADAGGDAERVRHVVLDVATMARVLCEGQELDMDFAREEPDEEAYLDMIYRKTARLFEVAARGGAIMAGAPTPAVRALETYGKAFGIAFQVQDDLLDLLGTTEAIGKPAASDIRAGKRTVVAIHALRTAAPADRAVLAGVLGKADATDKEVAEVHRVFRETGALDHAATLVRNLTDEAVRALETLPQTPARDLLADLARWQAERGS